MRSRIPLLKGNFYSVETEEASRGRPAGRGRGRKARGRRDLGVFEPDGQGGWDTWVEGESGRKTIVE